MAPNILGYQVPEAVLSAGQVTGNILITLFWMILLFLFLTIFFFYIFFYAKAITVTIRRPTNSGVLVKPYKMIRRTNKDGSVWWHTFPWQKKMKFPEPPNECINLTDKGKQYADVYQVSNDEFIYIKDLGYKGEDYQTVVKTLKPFTPVQRELLVNQYAKAAEKRKKGFMSAEFIMPAMSIVTFMVIFIMLLIYWKDISNPAIQSHQLALEAMDKQIKFAQIYGREGVAQIVQQDKTKSLPISNDPLKPPS